MTGIERLREFVGGISPLPMVCGVTKTAYDGEHMDDVGDSLHDFLADIADQIEREQGGRVSRMRVLAVVTEMERHVSGAEGMEDSPVARWARELREALGGDGRDPAADVSVSAYDLLPQEDREAIAWVRENGGLESVKERLDWVVGHCSTKQQLDFDFWLSGRVMYELGFDEDMVDRDEVERRLLDRLMPEGMKWPRYVSGEPVKFGDGASRIGGDFEVSSIGLYYDGSFSLNYWAYLKGERVKRPAVLAADGEPLEAGQTVYAKNYGYVKCTVLAIEWAVYGYLVEVENEGGHKFRQTPDEFTHQRPVLDADGVPIKKGDTVYLLPGEWCDEFPCLGFHGGDELEVFAAGEADHVPGSVRCREKEKKFGLRGTCYPQPSQLTHTKPEPPDSWERIEEDALNFVEDNAGIPHDQDQMERDMLAILRRCKALTERGE